MRVLFIILLFTTFLNATSTESCYTIQLISSVSSDENLNKMNSEKYPDDCRIMEIGKKLTVRCGCFQTVQPARERFKELQEKYKKSGIAKTYRYRFSDKNVQIDNKDEELRLMLQVFLYRSDLEKAYKIAKIAYKKYTKSYYWNQKLAQICQWSGRAQESMIYLKNLYKISRDKKLEEQLIDYGYEAYRYEDIEDIVVQRALRDPSEKNINFMIELYTKIGYPEKAIKILQDEYNNNHTKILFLQKALMLSLELGNLDEAHYYVTQFKNLKTYSKKSALLIAKYYYIKQNIKKAYEALLAAKDTKSKERDSLEFLKSFYELKSDLAWYIHDDKNAALASLELMKMQEARLNDYERISFFYQKREPELSLNALLESYLKYKHSYIFYSFVTEAIKHKKYRVLKALMRRLESKNALVTHESLYWMSASQLYALTKEKRKEQKALNRALQLDPNSIQVQISLLWFLLEKNDQVEIKMALQDFAQREHLDASFYFPLASAYLSLNDVNRANYYMQKLIEIDHPMSKTIDFELFKASLYKAQGRENLYKMNLERSYALEKKRMKEHPSLTKSSSFVRDYLRLSMELMAPDTFEKRLDLLKNYLKPKDYKEILYAYSLKLNADEMSLHVYNSIKEKELWLRYNNALMFQEHSNIENYIDLYITHLQSVNIAQAAYEDGQYALAQSSNFSAFLDNSYSQSLYSQHLSLAQQRSNKVEVKVANYHREPLLQEYIAIKDSHYLQDGYYLLSNFNYCKNRSSNSLLLFGFDSKTIEASVGVKKIFERGYIEFDVAYHNALRSYFATSLLLSRRFSSDLNLELAFAKNMSAQESTQLLLGGKKDRISLNALYSIVPSTQISLLHEENFYSAQDGKNLGNSRYSRLGVSKIIRQGYPDMKVGIFSDRGEYHEKSGSKGVIERLQNVQTPVLGRDFYDIGVSFDYGMANSRAYTRVWRPYMSVATYYNSELDNCSYSANIGYGGKTWHQDHLVLGASYSEALNGIGGKIFELFLEYQMLY